MSTVAELERPRVDVSLHPHACSGRLLAFCGVDGSGKTTALDLALQHLQRRGIEAVPIRMPSPAVRALPYFREYADDHTAARRGAVDLPALVILLLGDRLMTLRNEVLPALAKGQWALCDRYIWTAFAELHAVGCDEAQMKVIRDLGGLFPKPDISFVADVSVGEAISRVRSRPDECDFDPDRELLEAFLEGFRAVSRANDLCLYSSEQSLDSSKEFICSKIEALL